MARYCEYLQGRDQEDGVIYGYSTRANSCTSPKWPRRRWWERRLNGPSRHRQQLHCLGAAYLECPYYAPSRAELDGDADVVASRTETVLQAHG